MLIMLFSFVVALCTDVEFIVYSGQKPVEKKGIECRVFSVVSLENRG